MTRRRSFRITYKRGFRQQMKSLKHIIKAKKYEKQFSPVMSEVIGHLDYLEEQRKVRKELHKGVWHYFVS